MKRILKLILTGILLFCTAVSIVGCEEETNDTQSIDSSENVEEKIIENLELTIETEKTTYTKGENIVVNYTFKNGNKEDLEIIYDFFITPYIPTAHLPDVEFPPPEKGVLKGGEVRTGSEDLGEYLPLGTHEIQYRVAFWSGWDDIEDEEMIFVWSNTVEIVVTE